jgi:hypothetical protein
MALDKLKLSDLKKLADERKLKVGGSGMKGRILRVDYLNALNTKIVKNKAPSAVISNNPNFSVWALQSVSKEDSYPHTHQTIFLPKTADILAATKILQEDIKQEYYNRASVEGSKMIDAVKTPKQMLQFMNEQNDRSLSYYVVRIYPPSQKNLQREY